MNKILTGIILIISVFIHTYALANTVARNTTPLRVAVSSNFSPLLTQLIPDFYKETNIKVDIISASSGTLYQQILYGAPFDLFLSADDIHPQRLAKASLIVKNSLQTYALGQLAFWSANENFNTQKSLFTLLTSYLANNTKIAISNSTAAPYGQRAVETLNSLGLWEKFKDKVITGINVNQTFQQIRSQSVVGGFVALSQLKLNNLQGLLVEENLYTPIKQQLVILQKSTKKTQAEKFVSFLLAPNTQKKLVTFGYKIAQKSSLPQKKPLAHQNILVNKNTLFSKDLANKNSIKKLPLNLSYTLSTPFYGKPKIDDLKVKSNKFRKTKA